MSFKEVRSFTETMKSLGYPRLISLDNFRTPNFELVADCLHWLIHRFYPECSMSDDISTEAERVKFLQAAAQIMLAKARMKLNLKRLYAADGAAVRELLKLAELLHRATQTAVSNDEDASDTADPAAALKLLDAAAASAAAAEVARCGVALHDGLIAEGQLREARLRALAAAHDTSMVEAGIQETISGLSEALCSVAGKLQELASTERQLSARLDKRRSELERAEKRLATLAGVRPAYMDEYEALTGQLQVLWLHYLERFRNLQFLEAQLEGYRKAEQADADAAERRRRKMQRRLA
ncbi:Clusterin-associated protein-1 [Scenedesmus sp. NREL 46B-D3]|nr:Clusterin-associated protein-1 [Scenedesmus sp. NREL 46B-D3]